MSTLVSVGVLRLVLFTSMLLPLAQAAERDDTAPPVNAPADQDDRGAPVEIFLHANGSVTVTVGREKHLLPARQFRRQFPRLVAGKQSAVLRMEDWRHLETSEHLAHLHDAGIRRLTLQANIDGREKVQTINLEAPPLAVQLTRQLESPGRETRLAAIDKLLQLLRSDKPSDRVNALSVIHAAAQVRYDRARFLPLVRKSLNSPDQSEYGAALKVIALVGGDASDIPAVTAHVNHEKPHIRANLCSTLYSLDPRGQHRDIGPVVVKLLNDPEQFVRTATFKSLWGANSTPDVEARLIELSRGPSKGGSSEADEIVYYALSTRPLVRQPVAKRLTEIVAEKQLYSSRAVWGLSHHAADDAARPYVVDSLIQVVESQTEEETRRDALYGLGFHGGDKALQKLNSIVANDKESLAMREFAFRQLRGRNVAGAAPAPVVPATAGSEKPKELWQQIVQPHDAALRTTALAELTRLLKDNSTAAQGLSALIKAAHAPFDRAPYVPLVKPHIPSDDPEIRALALAALVTLGPEAIDPAAIAARAIDAAPQVRQAVAEVILRRDPKCDAPTTHATIERLLNDADPKVVQAMVRAVWGYPTSPAAEEILIDLSFSSDLGQDAVYYALSTRPLIRTPVAERLVDLTSRGNRQRGRAIWGLSHHAVDESANDLVVAALIEIVETTADGGDRSNAFLGLSRLRGPIARERLEEIATDPKEAEAVRNQVMELLRRQDEREGK